MLQIINTSTIIFVILIEQFLFTAIQLWCRIVAVISRYHIHIIACTLLPFEITSNKDTCLSLILIYSLTKLLVINWTKLSLYYQQWIETPMDNVILEHQTLYAISNESKNPCLLHLTSPCFIQVLLS